MSGRVTFVWGLKRSGIHLVVGWLYANLGGSAQVDLDAGDLAPQLRDGFRDPAAGVAFHNNCGGWHSRRFDLGELTRPDLERAAARQPTTVFGIEDCALGRSPVADLPGAAHVLVLRDPLNNLASRLAGAVAKPEVFRVDEAYVDLLDAYCAEYLGHTDHLPHRVVVSFNRFVVDRAYRDSLAEALGVENRDQVHEVSSYGGGSSFATEAPSAEELVSRFRQHPIPPDLLALLADRPSVQEACSVVFGYDLAECGAGA
ncbi:MAG: hypothetical protein ABL966_05255 [Acidimicrobiales bacterium]